jgi:hypothetical protein
MSSHHTIHAVNDHSSHVVIHRLDGWSDCCYLSELVHSDVNLILHRDWIEYGKMTEVMGGADAVADGDRGQQCCTG